MGLDAKKRPDFGLSLSLHFFEKPRAVFQGTTQGHFSSA
jgi:hypothetical protein